MLSQSQASLERCHLSCSDLLTHETARETFHVKLCCALSPVRQDISFGRMAP